MNILVVAPHADDEILGVGGTIAKYVDEGHNVYVCIVTTGHSSMYSKAYLDQVRSEVESAHQYLNIKETYFLNFPAVLIGEVPKYEINEKISKVIDEVKPRIVFLPHFGDMHLDHLLVSQSAMVAVRPIKEHKVLEVYSYEVLSETEWNVPHVKMLLFQIHMWILVIILIQN